MSQEYTPEETAAADQTRAREDVADRTTPGVDPRVEELRRDRERADPRYAGAATAATADTDRTQAPAGRVEGGDSELGVYRDRLTELQSRFIDDPKGAVEAAGSLVREAVDRLMESNRKGAGDTEAMRLAMHRYRHVLESLVTSGDGPPTRAAEGPEAR